MRRRYKPEPDGIGIKEQSEPGEGFNEETGHGGRGGTACILHNYPL